MKVDPLTRINTRTPKTTPQLQKLPGRDGERQVRNNAGGYVFNTSDDARLMRFLTLGTTGGTYYVNEKDHTEQAANFVIEMVEKNGLALVERVIEVSVAGRAPKQNPTLFALAAATGASDEAVRTAAYAAVPHVVRTGTHLFTFVKYTQQFRGWGNGLMKAVSRWYTSKDVAAAAYQILKYRNREGWTHRDVLRQAHPGRWGVLTNEQHALFDWVAHRSNNEDAQTKIDPKLHGQVPNLVRSFEVVQSDTSSVKTWTGEIAAYPLSWEMLPDKALSEPDVWKAFLRKGMPITALIRQLPRLTRLGLFDDLDIRALVINQLTDENALRKGRVHPISLLIAQRTYASGYSMRGSSTWTPDVRVIDALNVAYYKAYGTIEPSNKRTLVALDVSGSMGGPIFELPLTAREAGVAIALVTLSTEPASKLVGFTSGSMRSTLRESALTELNVSPGQRLDDAVKSVSRLPFGGTDCSLPMRWAKEKGHLYDTFIVITDNETWAGPSHVSQALKAYREWSKIPARMVVVGMTATKFSIADPTDRGSLDVAGFDSATPNMIADFSRGTI